MGMGVDGLGFGRCPEEPRHLGIALPVGLFGKGEIFPVGLGFAGKRFLQVLFGLAHGVRLLSG